MSDNPGRPNPGAGEVSIQHLGNQSRVCAIAEAALTEGKGVPEGNDLDRLVVVPVQSGPLAFPSLATHADERTVVKQSEFAFSLLAEVGEERDDRVLENIDPIHLSDKRISLAEYDT